MSKLLERLAFARSQGFRPDQTKYVIQQQMRDNLTPNSQPHWGHSDRYWVRQHMESQSIGHKLAKIKAKAEKDAKSRVPVPNSVIAYLTELDQVRIIRNMVEPQFAVAWSKYRGTVGDGVDWERVDLFDLGVRNLNNTMVMHMVHVSTEDATQIAYYPTLDHIRRDRPVRTRLGRYLTEYQSVYGLDEGQIKTISEKYMSKIRAREGWTVGFIEGNDEKGWLSTYNTEHVDSCMKGERAVRVYAHEHSVLRLAYVHDGAGVVARCIVRDEGDKTGWLRVYPDPNGYPQGRFLLDYLTTNGYEKRTDLDGVLLQAISYGNGYVCPYLDSGENGEQCVDTHQAHGKTFLICGEGDMGASNTNGYTEDTDDCECSCCGNSCDEDGLTYVESRGDSICESCLEDYRCAIGRQSHSHNWVALDDCVYINGDWYQTEYLNYHDIYQCDYDGDFYHIDDLAMTERGYVNTSDAKYIDHPDSEGNDYAHPNDWTKLSDGSICHNDDAERLEAELTETETKE